MIRAATVEDIAMIQQVAVKTWQHTYKGLLSPKLQQQFLAFDYNYRQLRKRITTSAFFVAEHAHNVVGFAHFTTTERIELEALYVLPTAQHQGFGRRLVEVGTTLFPQQTLYVRVLETNTQAIRFYEQLGFRYVSEEPFSAGADTFVVHLMQKNDTMKRERKGHIMSKKILIQLLFVIVMIAYLAYYDFQILNVNGVIMTVIIGLWVLATVMMIMIERATQK